MSICGFTQALEPVLLVSYIQTLRHIFGYGHLAAFGRYRVLNNNDGPVNRANYVRREHTCIDFRAATER